MPIFSQKKVYSPLGTVMKYKRNSLWS